MAPLPASRCVPCAVCGAEGARFNYQAYTCENCRVFFFRVVHRSQDFPECKKNCSIKPNIRRNCKSCRFRKCLEIGMQRTEVGRRLLSQVVKRNNYDEKMLVHHGTLINYGMKAAYRLKLAQSAAEFAGILYNFEKMSIGGEGKTILECNIDLDISICDLIQNPGSCASRDTKVFYPTWQDPKVPEVDYRTCWARSATAFSEFMGTIEEFHELSLDDKTSLFQCNYLIYTLSEVIFRQFVGKKNNYLQYSKIPYTTLNAPEDYWYQRGIIYRSYTISPIGIMSDLDISVEEYLFLRLIAMFYNGTQLSPKGLEISIRAREKYTLMMAEYIRQRHSDQVAIGRVGKILSLVRFMEEFSIIGKEKHTHMVVKNYCLMDYQLPRELHVMGTANQELRRLRV